MKYPYIVVKNGIWYTSGQDVPEGADIVVSEEKTKYKKTDINKMSTSELKELARTENVENAEDMTGVELKKVLIELFGL